MKDEVKTSRNYAADCRVLADWLDSKPEFPMSNEPFLYASYYTKEDFVAAVMALKPGTKEFTEGVYPEVRFRPKDIPDCVSMHIAAPRDKVCRKVQDVQWECEPLLSEKEEA